MAPFEPKTDSKEFEVALPGSAVPASDGATASAVDITIRLWRRDQAVNSAALTWNSESVLVYMIADLIAASHGCAASELSASMTAHFDNTNQAVVAAKRIQLAILEFVSCRPGDYLGAAVLIHPPAEAGFSSGITHSALRLSEPGQIILSETVSHTLRDLPGTELRPIAALTTGGSEHSGLSELVWASAEQIAKLRESARTNQSRVSTASQVGATMIVNAPALGTDAYSDRRSAKQDIPPAPPRDGHASNREGVFKEGLADFQERQSFLTWTRVTIGVVAVIVIGAAVALFYPSAKSKVPQKPQESESSEVQTTQAPQPAPPQPTLPVQLPDPQAKAQPPVNKPIPKPPVPKIPRGQGKDKEIVKKPEDTPIQGFEGNSTYDGMTQRDIPRLLQWARSDAGNGRYEKAGQEYRVILQLQPSNPDAKEGLRKLQLAQGHDE
jgi:hypothetical protein